MTSPAEHCGHQPNHVIGQPTECVLRPGHNGSHADDNGMRWWMRQTPDRPALDEMTSDQLDQLYEQLEQAELDAEQQERNYRALMNERTSYRKGWKYEQKRRAVAEATLNAIRALHERDPEADYCVVCSNHGDITWPCATVAVLDQHGQTPL